jgi:hypothetical protein
LLDTGLRLSELVELCPMTSILTRAG